MIISKKVVSLQRNLTLAYVQTPVYYIISTHTSPLGLSPGGEQRTVVDTLHTSEVAMSVYYHHPDRALQIIDSALLVGNID